MMLLADARLPTAAHTQSAGLEPAMNAGLTVEQVPDYLRARLATVTAVEAATAVVARNVIRCSSSLSAELRQTDAAWRARTLSPAVREASQFAARGYLRLLRRLFPDRIELGALATLTTPCRGVVLGVTAAIAGLSAGQVVRLIGHDDVATVAAAVLKVRPVDPALTTSWVLAAQPQIEALAAQLSSLTRPDEIPAFAAPLIEEWAEIHATATQRLFRA